MGFDAEKFFAGTLDIGDVVSQMAQGDPNKSKYGWGSDGQQATSTTQAKSPSEAPAPYDIGKPDLNEPFKARQSYQAYSGWDPEERSYFADRARVASGESPKPRVGKDGNLYTQSDWTDAKSATFDKLYGTGGSDPSKRFGSVVDLYNSGDVDAMLTFMGQAFEDYGDVVPLTQFNTYGEEYGFDYQDLFDPETGELNMDLLRKIYESEMKQNNLDEIAQDRSRWGEVGGSWGEYMPEWVDMLISAVYPDATEEQRSSKAREYMADALGAGAFATLGSGDYNDMMRKFTDLGYSGFEEWETPWSNMRPATARSGRTEPYGYGNYTAFDTDVAKQLMMGEYENNPLTEEEIKELLASEEYPMWLGEAPIDIEEWRNHPVVSYYEHPILDEYGNLVGTETWGEEDPWRKQQLKRLGIL